MWNRFKVLEKAVPCWSTETNRRSTTSSSIFFKVDNWCRASVSRAGVYCAGCCFFFLLILCNSHVSPRPWWRFLRAELQLTMRNNSQVGRCICCCHSNATFVSYFLSADACSLEESGNEANCSTQRVEGRSNNIIISSIESLWESIKN